MNSLLNVVHVLYISRTGCDVGFYGKNCTKCPDNCLNDVCHFQSGYCFDCKDGFKGEMCEGMQICEENLMLNETLISSFTWMAKTAKNALLT